jgi:hypothetical protein
MKGNGMTGKEEARIHELREQAAGIGAMIDGCLQTKRNRVVNKGGDAMSPRRTTRSSTAGRTGSRAGKAFPPGTWTKSGGFTMTVWMRRRRP